jgi:hypothetical protein
MKSLKLMKLLYYIYIYMSGVVHCGRDYAFDTAERTKLEVRLDISGRAPGEGGRTSGRHLQTLPPRQLELAQQRLDRAVSNLGSFSTRRCSPGSPCADAAAAAYEEKRIAELELKLTKREVNINEIVWINEGEWEAMGRGHGIAGSASSVVDLGKWPDAEKIPIHGPVLARQRRLAGRRPRRRPPTLPSRRVAPGAGRVETHMAVEVEKRRAQMAAQMAETEAEALALGGGGRATEIIQVMLEDRKGLVVLSPERRQSLTDEWFQCCAKSYQDRLMSRRWAAAKESISDTSGVSFLQQLRRLSQAHWQPPQLPLPQPWLDAEGGYALRRGWLP